MKMQKNMKVRIAAAAILTAAATTAQAQQLLLNGDFEQGALNQPGAPNWQTFNDTFTSGEYASTVGGKSFKAFGPFFQGGGAVGLQSTPAVAGESFTLTGSMFGPTGDSVVGGNFGLIELRYLNASNAIIPGSGMQVLFTSASPLNTWVPYTINSSAPAGTARAEVVIGHIQVNDPVTGGAIFIDDLSLTRSVVVPESTWISTGSGGWLSGSNWQGGVIPNSVGAVANFGSAITAPATVTIAGAGATSGTVKFNNANAYTVDGPGALTLDVASGGAALTVTSGSHAINAPLVINDSTTATIAAGQTLSIGGALTLNNGSHLTAAGAGTTRINATSVTGSAGATFSTNGGILQADVDLGSNVDVLAFTGEARFNATQHVRSVTVAANAKASVPDTAAQHVLRTPSLTIDAAGTLEIGDNAVVLDYTAGNSPAAAVRAAIITGRTGGGKGIVATKTVSDTSTAIGYAEASAVGSPTTFLGETGIDSTTLLIRVTLKGDATLNGTGKVWSEGDFDYDGDVDFNDLIPLAQNYGGTFSLEEATSAFGADFAGDWVLAQQLVPEPTTLAAVMGASALVLRRRRGAVA